MKKTLLGMASAALLVMAGPGFASPPHGGGYGHGGAYYGHGGGHYGHYGHGGYWGPGIGIYYGGLGYWGAGLYPYGWGYGYPYAYAPLVLEAQTVPQTFIQQEPAAIVTQEAPANSYWYYCAQPAGYFPYVQKCSQEWIKVVPQIPSGQPSAPRTAP